jgi:hypothetical protein
MSGGSFGYAFSTVNRFTDELGVKLDGHDEVDARGFKPLQFAPETLEKLREIEHLARRTAMLMREVEWLYSGDTSDCSFMRRVAEIESSNSARTGKLA